MIFSDFFFGEKCFKYVTISRLKSVKKIQIKQSPILKPLLSLNQNSLSNEHSFCQNLDHAKSDKFLDSPVIVSPS